MKFTGACVLAALVVAVMAPPALAAGPSPSPVHKGGLGGGGPALRSRATVGSARVPMAPPPHLRASGKSSSPALTQPLPAAQTATGSAWSSLGPQRIAADSTYGNVSGRVNAIAVDPTNANVIFAGTAGGGVWKSTDGGVTWSPTTDTQPTLAISSVAIDPTNHLVIYAGTGDRDGLDVSGAGLLKSTDGGTTWVQLGTSTLAGLEIGSIAIDRSSTQHVFVATNRGLYFSADSGITWTQNTQINSVTIGFSGGPAVSGGLYQVIQDPSSPTRFWATSADLCQTEVGQVLVSADSGATWANSDSFPTLQNAASRVALGVGPGGIAYAVSAQCGPSSPCPTCNYQLYDIEKTADSGMSWTVIPNTSSGYTDYMSSLAGGQGWYDNYVAVDPTDSSRAVFAGIDLLSTTDGGSSFTDIGKVYSGGPVHPDQHAVTFLGTGAFLLGNDGGIYKTTDNGGTGSAADWTNLNASLDITQFYAGASLDLTHMLGGAQDNASPGTFAGVTGNPTLPAWVDYSSGDGGYPAIDPTPGSNTIYTSYVYGLVYKGDRTQPSAPPTLAAPCNSNGTAPACQDPAAFIAPFLMDPSNPQHLLVATNRVYQSGTGGLPAGAGGWTKVSPVLTSGTNANEWISAMNMNPGGSVIVTGSVLGAVWRSVDGGTSWTNVTGNLPQSNFSTASFFNPMIGGVVANPSNPAEMWVTLATDQVGRIYHTTNAGAGAGTIWNDISWNLPNYPAYAITLDPLNPLTIYVGTAAGVYVCRTCGAPCPVLSWTPLGTGLPNAIVKYLTFTPDRANLIAWTYGRGAWSVPVGSMPPLRAALPAVANAAYGGYTTSAYVENLGTLPAQVNIHYFAAAGSPVGVGDITPTPLPPHASWSISQNNGDSFAAGGAGSAVVCSDQPVAAFVNEFAPGGGDATSYTSTPLMSGAAPTIYAPAIANSAYGGYTTGIGLVNLGATTANITVTYRDNGGAVVKTQNVNGVAPQAYRGLFSGDPTLALPAGFVGTATISSDALQPLAAVVNETGPGGQFSSYDAVAASATKLYAPAALNNAYGGYNTGFGIQNTTGNAGTVTITYFDTSGTPTVKSSTIAANGYLAVYQGTDIPTAGAYTARITSTVGIAAIVNEVAPSTNPSAQQSTAYNTFATGGSSLNLPLVESAGADGWSTGEGIMNTGTAATTVTVTYFDTTTGTQVGTSQSQLLQPNAFWGLYQPTGGLLNGTRATAAVTTSPGGQVAVICNESSATIFMSYGGQ